LRGLEYVLRGAEVFGVSEMVRKKIPCPNCKGSGLIETEADFAEPCKMNGFPYWGFCVERKRYERCKAENPFFMSNRECWLDDILVLGGGRW